MHFKNNEESANSLNLQYKKDWRIKHLIKIKITILEKKRKILLYIKKYN